VTQVAPRPARQGARSRRPRLIVTDLDGTFLSPDGTVSEVNAEAVRAAQTAEIPVLFATGRPVRWLEVIADLPGGHPTVIASNGAVLYDQASRTVLRRICLSPQATLRAIEGIRAVLPEAAFALESGTRFGHESHYVTLPPSGTADRGRYVGMAEEIAVAEDHVKMLVQHPVLDSDSLLRRVLAVVGNDLTVTHSATTRPRMRESGLVEISAPGVTKAAMLASCCERLGVVAADVAAFGDMPNDLDMLSWAGMPHVVANAHPRLLAAYPVVPSNLDSGVGRTILGWLS
jgi:HAD superfamily hydrolase (TIGR01484 family)